MTRAEAERRVIDAAQEFIFHSNRAGTLIALDDAVRALRDSLPDPEPQEEKRDV